MLPKDRGRVVNERLKAYGTTNLRVVDASIIPFISRGNTQTTVYAIAERAADLIKGTIKQVRFSLEHSYLRKGRAQHRNLGISRNWGSHLHGKDVGRSIMQTEPAIVRKLSKTSLSVRLIIASDINVLASLSLFS